MKIHTSVWLHRCCFGLLSKINLLRLVIALENLEIEEHLRVLGDDLASQGRVLVFLAE